jgi:four helix bundle protein
MDQQSVIRQAIDKTYHELEEADKPKERSRIAKSTNGYIHLTSWSNAQLLRVFVRLFTASLAKSEYRLRNQLNDAARSVVANIEEGYRRPTTAQYIDFLGYSQASLNEVKGDIQRSLQDGFLFSIPGSSLSGERVDLRVWHEKIKESVISRPAEFRGIYGKLEESSKSQILALTASQLPTFSFKNPLKSFTFLYPPVDDLNVHQLTYEIFIELINKTDWNLRKLVVSLEDKLARDQKYYQVEKARIRGNARWNR